MVSFSEYKDGYERDWANLVIRDNRLPDVRLQANRLLRGKEAYQKVEAQTGVPWWFAGLCHYRESNFNFNTYLGNGQRLDKVTTIVPKGRGPFLGPEAFVDGACDSLRLEGFLGANDWSIARVLYRLEGFNGYGYHAKGVNSPYLYGGSTLYGPPEAEGGKYVADHDFDPTVTDTQLGTAVILKVLLELDPSIDLEHSAATILSGRAPSVEPDDKLAQNILRIQRALNDQGANPPLVEDGKNGPKTKAAVSAFQRANGLADTGLADAATIAAILRKPKELASPAQSSDAVVAAIQELIAQLQKNGQIDVPMLANNLNGNLQQLASLLKNFDGAPANPQVPSQQDQAAQLQMIHNLLSSVASPSSRGQPLGQVNGALGQTIGNILNGKKTAVGTIGALLTALLANVPTGSGVADVLAEITPTVLTGAAGFSGYAMPIFLALAAWGVLGKLEKWAQGTAPTTDERNTAASVAPARAGGP